MFQFKQFAVDQTGCAMKINTDGVLLGAMANGDEPKHILDIGTGTGVIALMLAQRFPDAEIDALEIEEQAATTALRNFKNSPFSNRLQGYHSGFEAYLNKNADERYDLIVSNPPFYTRSLKSPSKEKTTAKHANDDFFDELVSTAAKHLSENGLFWLMLPNAVLELIKRIAAQNGMFINQITEISSFPGTKSHRVVVAFSQTESHICTRRFAIYESLKVYSAWYIDLLKDFFTIF